AYSNVTGQLVNETTVTSAAAPTALLAETGAALVYDTSVFGPTAPVLGERYRFAVAPTLGSARYTTITADYRGYLLPVQPFTIAVRAMPLGRYGSGSSDPRALPLVWTLRDVVRGYGDLGPAPGDALIADRITAANLELRFPLAVLGHWLRQSAV